MNTEQIEMEEIANIKPERKKVMASQVFSVLGNIFKWIIFALLILIVIANISNLYKIKVKKEQVPTFLGYANVVVVGNSMYPTLKIGDMIIVKHQNSYKVGDIITFIDDAGIVVTHRVIEISEDGKYYTEGDYVGNSRDPWLLDNSDIVGKVVVTLAGFGNVLEFFQTPWGLLILIGIGILIIELPYIIRAISNACEKKKIKKRLSTLSEETSESLGEGEFKKVQKEEDKKTSGGDK